MSGYATIIGLLCLLQVAFAISADEYAEAKAPNNMWPTTADDKRVPSSPFESVNDVVVLKNAGFPKVVRRGYAGEEFFMKASKSVPRIGRRNDAKESTKRSSNKDQMTVFWPKHDFDLQNGCHQLDAKTVYLADPYNYACNDQFYCCETPAKPRNGPTVNYV